MPQYDESFIFDDNANQRRNKRSYRVSRKGYYPSSGHESSTALAGHGTYVLKNNINNLKKNREFGSNYALQDHNGLDGGILYSKSENKSFPSLLDDQCKRNGDKFIFSPDIYTVKNNNYYSFGAGKSLENLASHGLYSPLKNGNGFVFNHTRGNSLQNLNESAPKDQKVSNKYKRNSHGYLPKTKIKDSSTNGNIYHVSDGVTDKKGRRLYEANSKYKERPVLKLTNRILESGVYRQLGKKTTCDENDDSGFAEDLNGVENPESGGGGSGHKASFRGANKLARRARSFKEDLLERISAMRSPGAPSTHTALPSLRSQSPFSSKGRNQPKEDTETNPTKEMESLVRQVKFDLKHFCDVISKKKLEMLPGNGTIVLDTITNIHTVIRPYVSPLGTFPSPKLESALTRLCQALADLIRLCDKSMIAGETCSALDQMNVQKITEEVQKAVEDLAKMAFEEIYESNSVHLKPNGTAIKESKNLKMQPRPAADITRISTSESQRNSLPDIPLTPHERQILENVGNGYKVRSSHSTESILDSVSPQDPPPKPPIPLRSLDIAPPLPPKRKPIDSCHLSTTDRSSLQSHSSGSLDSMLNVSNDDEIRAIMMDRNSTNMDDSLPISIDNIDAITSMNNRLSLDIPSNVCVNNSSCNEINSHSHTNDICLRKYSNNQNVNQSSRFSSESGFVSIGNTNSELSYSSFNSSLTQQKSSLSFIDSTPTPGDLNPSMLTNMFSDEKRLANVASAIHHSMKQMSSSGSFEQSAKTFTANESKLFNHSTICSSNTIDVQKTSSIKVESNVQSFSQKSSTQTLLLDKNSTNKTSVISNFKSSSDILKSIEGSNSSIDVCDSNTLPPALPVKTRKQGRLGIHNESLNDHSGISSIDDQIIEFRDHASCAFYGHADRLIQRPHTLMDQSLSSGQPPPLPMKKKHMFQSVAYSVMAYMEMFGNCNHSPQSSSEFLRHSVHAYDTEHQHATSRFVSSAQLQHMSNATLGLNNNLNGQTLLGCNQQLTQSHTLHQFSITAGSGNCNQQNVSGFTSPVRSPHFIREDSIKSDASSINSISTNSSTLPIQQSTSPIIPPALPPKKTKIRQTPNHSPAKPPLSPKPPIVVQSGTASPTTPAPLVCTTPNGRVSTSPAPRFQFDPPSVTLDNDLLLNVEDDQWQQNTNKPGKFPVDDLDLEKKTDSSSGPNSCDDNSCDPILETETEGEPDLVLEMDVSSKLVLKRTGEEGPEIKGGHPDALVVHAIKPTKDFSYQEAFLTTYRTFVSPLQLIEKLNKRHIFLTRHGKHTKAREVQALLARVVGDLTMADMDDEQMVNIILEFVYNLVCSGDLAMAKVLRVIILDKYRAKQLVIQQQQSLAAGLQWTATVSARRDSVLEQKAEAVAEQMTLLDAELFTRIPAPEALLWARDQCEERSPNLTRFTEHFNKMSYWARSRILEQEEAREREKYVSKFMKVMKHLRKMNNFNSYLALLSALDSAPIRRLDWQKHITDGLKEFCALIDSSSSFRAYRQALLNTQPPCIPYIGLVLQDLTFVHIGNSDLLPDGNINFSKRWQQYHILENMKRFSKAQYTFKKNERIIAMFNGFDDVLNEEAMWQISESIKPRGGKKNNTTT